jgi:hypothetical protein
MPTLYSYCIPTDGGAAPNPFWGICTLAICKPVIRRVAQLGDWIVGTGSKEVGFDNMVVYAMEVTQKFSMKEYDAYCKEELPKKIPNWRGPTYKERVGDCIYDFSYEPARIRRGVHNEDNRSTDMGGKSVLLSAHFYYFGEHPVILPKSLLPIVKQGQAHKSVSNHPYFESFLSWILDHRSAKNKIVGEPQTRHLFTLNTDYTSKCATRDKRLDDLDEEMARSRE